MPSNRRFPPPWSIEELNDACFVVKDASGGKSSAISIMKRKISRGDRVCKRSQLLLVRPFLDIAFDRAQLLPISRRVEQGARNVVMKAPIVDGLEHGA
jgi:hypothetical protein